MEARFETAFLKAVKKKVDMILADPIAMGESLKGNWQGFYSCPVKRNFIIIYLYCAVCRKKEDDTVVLCADCTSSGDQTVKFLLLGPHDATYQEKR